jgi:hypothetical protein
VVAFFVVLVLRSSCICIAWVCGGIAVGENGYVGGFIVGQCMLDGLIGDPIVVLWCYFCGVHHCSCELFTLLSYLFLVDLHCLSLFVTSPLRLGGGSLVEPVLDACLRFEAQASSLVQYHSLYLLDQLSHAFVILTIKVVIVDQIILLNLTKIIGFFRKQFSFREKKLLLKLLLVNTFVSDFWLISFL